MLTIVYLIAFAVLVPAFSFGGGYLLSAFYEAIIMAVLADLPDWGPKP